MKTVDLHQTTDARVWAKEWLKTVKTHPVIASDEEAMVGWFSNAIMAGYDGACKKLNNDWFKLRQASMLYRKKMK